MIDILLLTETVTFNGSLQELKETLAINRKGKFYLDWIDDKHFKFKANISVGTLIVNGFRSASDGINGYGTISKTKNGQTSVLLKTKLRIELYFLLVVFLFIFFCGFMSDDSFPIWIYFLLPVFLSWFWVVYRVQEKSLFSKVIKVITNG